MNNIKGWNKFHIHPFVFIYLILSVFIDNLDLYLLSLLLVAFHELGHIIIAYYFKFDINNISVLPFGIFLELNDYGMHPIYQEVLLVVMGPIFSLILMLILPKQLLIINQFILVYNILPIYPLDGSKLLLLILERYFDIQKAIKMQTKISILTIVIILLRYFNLGYLLVLMYLFYYNYRYIKEYRYLIIATIISDQNDNHKQRINHQYNYYRGYNNYYIINNQIIPLKSIKTLIIKSIKND